jgi:hypothetical protein
VNYGNPKLDNEWEYQLDNDFASNVLATFKANDAFQIPVSRLTDRLCNKCHDLCGRLWDPTFSIIYDIQWLEAKSSSKECDLCSLFLNANKQHSSTRSSTVQFELIDSYLRMNGEGRPALSVFRSPGEYGPLALNS